MLINYNLELSQLMIEEFKCIYKIDNSKEMYKYLICRFICSNVNKFNNLKRDISNLLHLFEYRRDIIDFILNELDIITNLDYIEYKNSKISIYGIGGNSIIDTLLEIESECIGLFEKDDFFEEVIDICKKAINSSKRKSSSKKNSIYYNYYLIYYSLMCLNKILDIKEIDESKFHKNINFIQSEPSIKIEDKCCRYINSIETETNDALTINEDILEKFIYKNLDIIEEGLTPIKRQYVIQDGRLDILAKDKNNIYTIIELKVENDTDLIFQCVHYSTQLKKEKKLSNVRVITICPEYTYGILNALKHISKDYNVESYICSIKSKGITNKEIDFVKLIKVI